MSNTISGGCLCGAIRFETTAEPVFQLLCHCKDCQTVSGAAAYAAYVVPLESLHVTRGQPNHFEVTADSGRTNSRHFCPNCGARVWAVLEEMGMASVNGLALDDRSHFQPTANHMAGGAPDWCTLGDLPST
ncbi:MAG: GFA family protein [Pseudomonadota bacterium]